jgi:predicted small integral membrane protein
VAFFVTLVVFNNLTDYYSNYAFVVHVLKMDTTFPNNQAMWRAIDSVFFHHAFYWGIIFVEAAIALLCWVGGFCLLRSKNDAIGFNKAKGITITGLSLGIVLFFSGFITIGGEWFLMWQSNLWNGQETAFRLVVILGIVLIYTVQPDRESDV